MNVIWIPFYKPGTKTMQLWNNITPTSRNKNWKQAIAQLRCQLERTARRDPNISAQAAWTHFFEPNFPSVQKLGIQIGDPKTHQNDPKWVMSNEKSHAVGGLKSGVIQHFRCWKSWKSCRQLFDLEVLVTSSQHRLRLGNITLNFSRFGTKIWKAWNEK